MKNPIDKAIAVVSPQWAVNRAEARAKLSRYEAAYPSKKRKSHGHNKDSSSRDKQDPKEKKNIRVEANRFLKNNSIAKYVFRDGQTYLAPTGWVAQTGNKDANKKIRRLTKAWMRKADFTNKNHLLDIFSLGAGMQIMEGDMGLGLIKSKRLGLQVQPIRAARIGAPPNVEVHFDDDNDKKRYKELNESGLYFNGVESNEDGAVVRYWIFKEKFGGEFAASQWVFDKTFEAENFLRFNDPIDIDEERGVSELAQSIDDMKDNEECMSYMKQKVKAQASRAGTWSSPYGDNPENPLEDENSVEGEPDENGNVVTRIPMDDGVDVLAIDSEYQFTPFNEKLPDESFGEFMARLLASPAFSMHLPPAFLGIKNKQLQGTDVRSDNSKAQTEYERKREHFDRMVYTPLMEAQIAYWHAQGEFEDYDVKLTDLLTGRWGYRKDLTVDEGYRSGKMIAEAKMGWTNDADVARMKGYDEEEMKAGRETQADEILETAIRLADKHKVSVEVVIRLLKDQNLGTVPPVDDDFGNPSSNIDAA